MAREKNDKITLGSGDLMIKEFNAEQGMPEVTAFTDASDLLGRILGGATLEYTGEWYEVKDDTGKVVKTILVTENVTLKSGVLTWNGQTLAKLCSTARVTEKEGMRYVKIGGAGNYNGKSYAICFHHKDKVDGDIWIIMRGVNQGGISMAFAKDKETVVDAEFKAMPMDDEGTLVEYVEQIGQTL